jgi:mediator of RNA polymerase II transcription subunit 21
MTEVNEEYIRAVDRASACYTMYHVYRPLTSFLERLHCQFSELLRMMLDNADVDVELSSKSG